MKVHHDMSTHISMAHGLNEKKADEHIKECVDSAIASKDV